MTTRHAASSVSSTCAVVASPTHGRAMHRTTTERRALTEHGATTEHGDGRTPC